MPKQTSLAIKKINKNLKKVQFARIDPRNVLFIYNIGNQFNNRTARSSLELLINGKCNMIGVHV